MPSTFQAPSIWNAADATPHVKSSPKSAAFIVMTPLFAQVLTKFSSHAHPTRTDLTHDGVMSSPRSPRARHLLAVAAVLLVASACGSDSDDATVGADSDPPTTTTSTELADPTEPSTDTDEAFAARPVDLDRFFDGALAAETTTAGCTLSGGTTTTCYGITVAGYPTDDEVGPFCPRTTEDTADEVGIWFDGDALYDIDGQFILDLPEIYDDENWHLHDDEGNVNVTDTPEAFAAAARPDVDPEYQHHCVEGMIEWLDGGEPVTSAVDIPTTPVPADTATPVGPFVGVTLNGVIIAGEAPVEAILGAYTIAAFDDCGGHINPFDGYHIHGATGCSEAEENAEGETPAFAYALDGFAIHSPLAEDEAATADLDQCNGHATEELGYHYHAAQAEENAVLTCFTGETSATEGGDEDGPPGGGPPPGE